jgi:transcription elongation factor Elf1
MSEPLKIVAAAVLLEGKFIISAPPPPRMFTCPGCGMEKQVQWTDPETSMALTRQPYIWCGNGPIMLAQCRGCGVLMGETQAMYCERCEPT